MSKFPTKKELYQIRKKLKNKLGTAMLSPNASVNDRIKYGICQKIIMHKRLTNQTQKELALQIGIDEALMSKVLHYQISEFTIDRLIRYLSEIFKEIEVKIKVA